MRIAQSVAEATFVQRQGRFSCLVEMSGARESVYLPNSGRLDHVLVPGQTVFLAEKASRVRRTRYDLVAASVDGTLVSVDSRIPGELVHDALLGGKLPPFESYSSLRREVPRGRSRLDFLLSGPNSECFVEVKSVTLVQERTALFPDAPTLRGAKHLDSLVWAKRDGYAAAVVFVIQRWDARSLSPNDVVDAEFARRLRSAHRQGVGVYAYRCRITPVEIELDGQVPVDL